MIYSSVLNAVVSALAAEMINNVSTQAWQKAYQSEDEDSGVDRVSLVRSGSRGVIDRTQVDSWVGARLRHNLQPAHWHALVARYSSRRSHKVEAIGVLHSVLAPKVPATIPSLFLYKGITAWAVPKLAGARPKAATVMSPPVPVGGPAWRREAAIKAAVAVARANAVKEQSSSSDAIVLKHSFYNMNTWDNTGKPESPRRRWRKLINEAASELVSEALICAEGILRAEGVLIHEVTGGVLTDMSD